MCVIIKIKPASTNRCAKSCSDVFEQNVTWIFRLTRSNWIGEIEIKHETVDYSSLGSQWKRSNKNAKWYHMKSHHFDVSPKKTRQLKKNRSWWHWRNQMTFWFNIILTNRKWTTQFSKISTNFTLALNCFSTIKIIYHTFHILVVRQIFTNRQFTI